MLQNALKDFSDDIVVETDISVALETEEYPCDLHYLEDQYVGMEKTLCQVMCSTP